MVEHNPLPGILVVAVFWQRKGSLRERALHARHEDAVSRLGTGMGAGAFARLSRCNRGIEAMGICNTAAGRLIPRVSGCPG